jgi:hypothetical protein
MDHKTGNDAGVLSRLLTLARHPSRVGAPIVLAVRCGHDGPGEQAVMHHTNRVLRPFGDGGGAKVT